MTVVFEPAEAIAAGLCLTARTIAKGVTNRHPRPCGWCEYSIDELRQLIEGYNAWAGYKERGGTYERHEARLFQGLPRAEQARLVEIAQAFPSVPEAVKAQPPPPADAPAAQGPAWFHRETP